jgi:hypothetical protein
LTLQSRRERIPFLDDVSPDPGPDLWAKILSVSGGVLVRAAAGNSEDTTTVKNVNLQNLPTRWFEPVSGKAIRTRMQPLFANRWRGNSQYVAKAGVDSSAAAQVVMIVAAKQLQNCLTSKPDRGHIRSFRETHDIFVRASFPRNPALIIHLWERVDGGYFNCPVAIILRPDIHFQMAIMFAARD